MRQSITLDTSGLSSACRPQLHRLGHRGSRLVYVADNRIQRISDPGSGLTLFAIDEVFGDCKSVLLGFGTPNTFLTIHREENDPKGPGWDKFAAFMFWRQKSYVANTKGRVQAGMFFELRNLSDVARDAIREQMRLHSGKRGPSCARMNAEVLASSGFTFGNGRSLRTVTRPTKFATLLWRHGLSYEG